MGTKISELTAGTKPTGVEVVPTVQGGVTVKLTEADFDINPEDVKSISADYTATTADRVVVFTGAATATLTLYSTATTGARALYVKNSSSHLLTLAAHSGQTVEGSASLLLSAGGEVKLVPSGTNWLVISESPYRSTVESAWYPDLQTAINATPQYGRLLVTKSYTLTASVTLKSQIEIIGSAGVTVSGNFDGPLFTSSGQIWRTVVRGISFTNNNAGVSAGCVKITGYQTQIESCFFTAQNGYGIYLNPTDYSVENDIRRCYFYSCKFGIYSPTGASYNTTDAWVVDNYFYGNGYAVNAIYWAGCSGSTFRGNHFYGGASRFFMEMSAGVNVSILDNYFEGMDNPRVYINPGNPGSWALIGNKFWQGNGSGVDFTGAKQSLIRLELGAGVNQRVSLTGNIFEGGTNSVDVLKTNASTADESFKTVGIVMTGNVYNGSYVLGTGVLRVIQSDPRFEYVHTDRNSALGLNGSVERYTNAGFAESYPTLPGNTVLEGKTFLFINESAATTLQIQTGAITKNGTSTLPPKSKWFITMRGGQYYIY